jgi:hypothetical protein
MRTKGTAGVLNGWRAGSHPEFVASEFKKAVKGSRAYYWDPPDVSCAGDFHPARGTGKGLQRDRGSGFGSPFRGVILGSPKARLSGLDADLWRLVAQISPGSLQIVAKASAVGTRDPG